MRDPDNQLARFEEDRINDMEHRLELNDSVVLSELVEIFQPNVVLLDEKITEEDLDKWVPED
jgi:hypothetical protein